MRLPNYLSVAVLAAIVSSVATVGTLSMLKSDPPTSPDVVSDLVKRLDRLETRIDDELQQQASSSTMAKSITSSPSMMTQEISELDEVDLDEEPLEPEAPAEVLTDAYVSESDYKRQLLSANGFTQDEITWIEQQESDLTLERLNQQYEAQRRRAENGDLTNGRWARQNNGLREKLGDDYYERYLEAYGLPTKVTIDNVIDASPGDNAGLAPGDRVVRYNGVRVFNIQDINQLTITGEPGQSVLLEVERDGQPLQLTIPRGPIGITSSGRRFGRRPLR